MLIDAVWPALTDAGVQMTAVDAWHVELRYGRHRARLAVKAYPHALNPSDVADLVRGRDEGLLLVPAATEAARRTVERAGWSFLVAGPDGVRGVVRLRQKTVRIGNDGAELISRSRSKPGRVPWGSLTLVRRLFDHPPSTQSALADMIRLSQPRVSQTLANLSGRELIERDTSGWAVRDVDGLLRFWLDDYPGPRGISTYWYGLEPPGVQVEAVMRLLARPVDVVRPGAVRAAPMPRAAVISGDVAADLIAPWRTPTRAIVYASTGADLDAVGLTPVGQKEATLELIVPQDPGVWPSGPQWPPGRRVERQKQVDAPIADLLQILWDVRRSPGPDSAEAADVVRELIHQRHRAMRTAVAR